jgi:hypothetical protein
VLYNAADLDGAMVTGAQERLQSELRGKFDVTTKTGLPDAQALAALSKRRAAVILLGKGGESEALHLFKTAGLVSAKSEGGTKALLMDKFKGGEGVTLRHLAVVATTGLSRLPGGESFSRNLIGNLVVHEGGHAISRHRPPWDHTTGGVMAPSIVGFDGPLHYTARFLKQFDE